MRTYPFYVDPGHGWLAVPLKELELLPGLLPTISQYSYVIKQDGKYIVWLEEDCDASRFHNKAIELGLEFKCVQDDVPEEVYPIRDYPRWNYALYKQGYYKN